MAQQWPGSLAEDHDAAQAAPAAQQRAVTIYSVRLPSGATFEVRGPANATPAQLQQLAAADPGIANTQTDITGAQFEPKATYDGQALAEYQQHGRVAGRDEKLAPDEQVVFGDEQGPKTAPRFTPEQEQQIMARTVAGDVAGALALGEQFGIQLNPESVQKTADFYQIPENRGKDPTPIGYGPTDKSAEQAMKTERYRQFADMPIDELRKNDVLPESADAFVRGGGMGLDDEIDGIVSSVLHGGSVDDNMARARAIQDYDEQNNFGARMAGGFVGSLALPTKFGNVARPAAAAAFREAIQAGETVLAARTIAQKAARNALVGQLTKEGGIYGGGIGAADADGGIADRLGGALAGGAQGAGLAGMAGLVGTQARRLSLPSGEQRAFMRAADRQNVEPLPADLPGAYGSQFATSVTNSSLGAIPLAEGAEKAVASLASARDDVAGAIGNVRDAPGVGQAIQRGVYRELERTQGRTNQLYEAIPIAAEKPAVLDKTRESLSELTKGFTSNRQLSKLWADDPRLESTLEAISTSARQPGKGANFAGSLSWHDLKHFRSIVGGIIEKPSMTSEGPQIARLRKLYGALSADMRATAAQEGPAALRSFERANTYARARSGRIENTFKGLLGNDYQASAESALGNLMRWSNEKGGNFAAVARTFRSLPPEEANDVRASIFQALGRASKGRQDATQEVFSPSDFMTHWSGLSERAKNVLFQGEHRKAIDDIVTLASGMKASGKFANTSKTGIALGATGTFAAGLANPVYGVLSVASQLGAGRLLAEPKFARWLVGLGKKPNPSAVRDHVRRLAGLAGSLRPTAPAIANDILGLQAQLSKAFSGGMEARLAAEQPVNEAPRIQAEQDSAQGYPGEELPQ